jgi:hypothetical protein
VPPLNAWWIADSPTTSRALPFGTAFDSESVKGLPGVSSPLACSTGKPGATRGQCESRPDDVHGSGLAGGPVPGRTHREVAVAVVIQIAETGQRRSETLVPGTALQVLEDQAVAPGEDVHLASVRERTPIPRTAEQVGHAVAIHVAR